MTLSHSESNIIANPVVHGDFEFFLSMVQDLGRCLKIDIVNEGVGVRG